MTEDAGGDTVAKAFRAYVIERGMPESKLDENDFAGGYEAGAAATCAEAAVEQSAEVRRLRGAALRVTDRLSRGFPVYPEDSEARNLRAALTDGAETVQHADRCDFLHLLNADGTPRACSCGVETAWDCDGCGAKNVEPLKGEHSDSHYIAGSVPDYCGPLVPADGAPAPAPRPAFRKTHKCCGHEFMRVEDESGMRIAPTEGQCGHWCHEKPPLTPPEPEQPVSEEHDG